MALVLKKLYLGYNEIFIENSDPRTHDLWGIPSQPILLGFIGFYLYFVQVLGPRLMKNRPPFHIRFLLIVYNSLQILANLWIAYEYSYIYWRIHEGCIPIDYSTSALGLHEVAGGRLYFWLKMFDSLDTNTISLQKSFYTESPILEPRSIKRTDVHNMSARHYFVCSEPDTLYD
ncbi:hypothetical protein JTB14_016767 [Gonioctena quinquepunctata]|nr:hypothetical protein JTB14_016767 [Gonioctena quinquepunctata]